MTHPMDFRELWAAREGLPTEQQAARKIATFAVIPAAMVGLLAGTRFVDVADPNGRLAWVCTATACGAGFGIAGTVLGIYSLFGFRPVAILADALTGMFCGLLCGGAIAMVLMRFKLAPGQWCVVAIASDSTRCRRRSSRQGHGPSDTLPQDCGAGRGLQRHRAKRIVRADVNPSKRCGK